ncbi:MAG: nicotinate-nucleotide adenylyltransferase [Candidatus Paceibacterota bacterium]
MVTVRRRVGILGTSANPLHAGHIALARTAKHVLRLDEVVLMVDPQNPLKDVRNTASVEHRLALARLALQDEGTKGAGLSVSDFEVALRAMGHRDGTAGMLRAYAEAHPDVQPVWLMGADILAELHTWGSRWEEIMEQYPVGVFGRGDNHAALYSFAARKYSARRKLVESFSCEPGTWCLFSTSVHPASSTEVRRAMQAGIPPVYVSVAAYSYMCEHALYHA